MRHGNGEALPGVLTKPGLEPRRLLVGRRQHQDLVGWEHPQRVLDRLQRVNVANLGVDVLPGSCVAGGLGALGRVSACVTSSAFVSRSSQEIFDAGAITRTSASSPACARTIDSTSAPGAAVVVTTRTRRAITGVSHGSPPGDSAKEVAAVEHETGLGPTRPAPPPNERPQSATSSEQDERTLNR